MMLRRVPAAELHDMPKLFRSGFDVPDRPARSLVRHNYRFLRLKGLDPIEARTVVVALIAAAAVCPGVVYVDMG